MKTFPYTAHILAKLLREEADRIQLAYDSADASGEGAFWTGAMKRFLEHLATQWRGVRAIYTRPGESEFLLDLVWWQACRIRVGSAS